MKFGIKKRLCAHVPPPVQTVLCLEVQLVEKNLVAAASPFRVFTFELWRFSL